MTQQLSLERQIADWMADEASGPAPDQLIHEIDMATSRVRPLPRWLAVVKEPTMTTFDRTVVGIPKRPLIVLALLGILATAATIGAALLFLQRPSSQEDWPGYRGDASRTGLAVTGPIGQPVVRWKIHAAGAVRSAIVITGDLALFGSDEGVLHAVSVDTGAERWAVPVPGVREGPFVVDDRIYVADGNGLIHAFARDDGRVIWASTTTAPGLHVPDRGGNACVLRDDRRIRDRDRYDDRHGTVAHGRG